MDLLNNSSTKWNLILYEQDWMNHETIDFISLRENFNLGRQYLIEMGHAANIFDVNIQYCMSLPPFKGIFWSTEIQNDAPYKSKVIEPLPDREILIATLSKGPIAATGDGINYINRERIMRCCREDGLILKPSRPLTMIDLLISDWAKNKGINQSSLLDLSHEIYYLVF
ncbi:hypothetical protein I4U23_027988 [Adineta vaga]|nr:hypothetical protein I4U23_027988 [Adineta vaga]